MNRQSARWQRWFSFAFALAILVASWRFLLLNHRVPLDGNMITLYFPNWVYASRSLSHGHWPLWNPFRDLGEPFWADPQTLAAYPVFWFMAPVRDFWVFLVAWYLAHSLLAAIFFALLAYHYKPRGSVAAMSAILGSLNGYFLSHLSPNVFASAAWVPAVLFYAVRGSVWGAGACLGAQWLAGFPDFSVLTVVAITWISARQGRAGLKRLILIGCLV